MNTTVISVKVDKEVKNNAQEIAKSMGISLSTLVNSYLRQVVATRRVELFAPEPMSPELEKAIEIIESEIKTGQISEKYESADTFLTALKSR